MTKNNLLKEIEHKREELNQIVHKNGMSAPITIQYSQELDKMLYEYQQERCASNAVYYQ